MSTNLKTIRIVLVMKKIARDVEYVVNALDIINLAKINLLV